MGNGTSTSSLGKRSTAPTDVKPAIAASSDAGDDEDDPSSVIYSCLPAIVNPYSNDPDKISEINMCDVVIMLPYKAQRVSYQLEKNLTAIIIRYQWPDALGTVANVLGKVLSDADRIHPRALGCWEQLQEHGATKSVPPCGLISVELPFQADSSRIETTFSKDESVLRFVIYAVKAAKGLKETTIDVA